MTKDRKWGVLTKVLRWLIPIGISGIAVWLVIRQIELSQFVNYLTRIGWGTFLLASMVYFISLIFRVLCWYILLKRKVSFGDTFFTMCAGYLLNNVLPFRLGEVGRAVLLDDPEKHPAIEVFSSIVVERVFDVFLAAVFVLSMLPRLLVGTFNPSLILVVMALAILGLVLLYLAAKFRHNISAWLAGIGTARGFFHRRIVPSLIQILKGLSVLNDPRSFLLAFGSLTISWFLAFVENFIIFRSFYPDPPFWWMIFVLSAGAFGAALPSAPSGLGVFEGVMVGAFALLGVAAEPALTHAVIIHGMAFVYANVLGLIGLQLRGEAVISFFKRILNRSSTNHPLGSA